jgi:prepilin-type N-terminal cleavage/methylation domain-containing protein
VSLHYKDDQFMRNSADRSNLNASGFTLVELMIVVAITRILAAIAVPNYMIHQARARQQEGRIALATVYAAERNFVVEQGSFTNCLKDIGVVGVATNRNYAIGVSQSDSVKCGSDPVNSPQSCNNQAFASPGLLAIACTGGAVATFIPALTKIKSGAAMPLTASSLPSSLQPVTSNTFQAAVVGQISQTNTGFDIWTIDQNNSLINLNSGL